MPEKLKQLLAWFDAYQITFNEITLSECEQIFDLTTDIDVYTRSVKRNWANPTFEADIRSLYRLKKILEENDNPAE